MQTRKAGIEIFFLHYKTAGKDADMGMNVASLKTRTYSGVRFAVERYRRSGFVISVTWQKGETSAPACFLRENAEGEECPRCQVTEITRHEAAEVKRENRPLNTYLNAAIFGVLSPKTE